MSTAISMLPGYTGKLFHEARGNSYATSPALAYVLKTEGYDVTATLVWSWRQTPGFPESGDVRSEESILDHAELVKRWAIDEGVMP